MSFFGGTDADGWAHVDFEEGFGGELVAAGDFEGTVYGGEDGVAGGGVGCGAVGFVEGGEGGFWGHGGWELGDGCGVESRVVVVVILRKGTVLGIKVD